MPTTEKRSTQWHSPYLALLWKEWRESWWLLILTVAAPLTWHDFMPPHPERWVVVSPPFIILALCLGARLFAGEAARGTARFRDERPVARGLTWTAAITLPVCAILVGVLGKAMCVTCGAFEVESPSPTLFFAQLFAEGLLAFAMGALLSVMMERPVTAVAAGAVLCVAGVMLLAAATFHGSKAKWGVDDYGLLTFALHVIALVGLLLSRRFYGRRRRE